MYDIIFVGEKNNNWEDLKKKFPSAKHAQTLLDAKRKAFTKMFWVVWDELNLDPNFKFDHKIEEYDYEYKHVFKNGSYYDGVCLFSKKHDFSQKEIDYRFFLNKKEIDLQISYPLIYDKFVVSSYEDYCKALESATTNFVWIIPDDVVVDNNFNFECQVPTWDKDMVHVFKNKDYYDGIFICHKTNVVSKREFDHRFFLKKTEVDVVASIPARYDMFFVKSYEDYTNALEKSNTQFFWIVPNNLEILETFDFDHQVPTWERDIIHIFKNGIYFDGVFVCHKENKVSQKEFDHRFFLKKKEIDTVATLPKTYDKFYVNDYNDYCDALEKSTTEFLWVIPTNVDVLDTFEFDYQLPAWERDVIHVFKNGEHNDGVFVCHQDLKVAKREFEYYWFMKKNEVDVQASMPHPYDIVFISYQEPNADENYAELCERFPRAKRVHGVKGIHQAHIAAAKECSTDMIWIVDGDAVIVDDFNFDYQVPKWQRDQVYVWRSQNPVNDMVYGYGGVKLFPRKETINMDTSKPDMTTSISPKFNAVKEISNITAFNTGPFETWKSAFRECCKLASKVIDRQKSEETDERLKIWTTVGRDKKYGEHALAGARAGMMYGSANKGNVEALKKINDFDWLKEQFNGNV
jgi:hypothetical protein